MKSVVPRHLVYALAYILIALVIGSALSTQLFAHLTNYHQGLGAPLAHFGSPLYAPTQWYSWVWSTGASDLSLVLRSALPLIGFITAAAYVLWRVANRPEPHADSPKDVPEPAEAFRATLPSDRRPRTQQLSIDDLEEVAVVPLDDDGTQQLSWEDVEEVLPEEDFRALTQQLSLEDIEEIDVLEALTSSAFDADATLADSSFEDSTRQSDSIAYRILQALAAQPDTPSTLTEADATPLEGIRVGSLDSTSEHDAPTAEAPARSPVEADTVDAPAARPVKEPLHVDEPRSEWAYEVATAEAPVPDTDAASSIPEGLTDSSPRTTARFTDIPTAEQPTPQAHTASSDDLSNDEGIQS